LVSELERDVVPTPAILALDTVFNPNTVAVVGASERELSVGRTVFANMLAAFSGEVFPVSSKRTEILGHKSYPCVADIAEPIDLVVVTTPAGAAPAIMDDCAAAGVRAAVIISAGFREAGPEGTEIEKQVLERAAAGGIRLIGPNCLGVMNPRNGLNATFAAGVARPGSIAFLSQSGALGTAVLDWSMQSGVGFSGFASTGAMADMNWGDLITYFGDDPHTRSILLYIESIGDPCSFLSAVREVALSKPVIAIKAGRTEAAAQAAASHTGAMAGADDALDAAFRRAGLLRVDTIAELFYMAEILDKQPRPKGPRLTIITNAGGPGVLATDSLLPAGGALTPLAPETIETLNQHLPTHWSHGNPVDVLGDADADRYAKAFSVAAKDPASDGLLVILTPQAMTDAAAIATNLAAHVRASDKPVLASWMGGEIVEAGRAILRRAGIPTLPYPDTAARLFAYMWQHSKIIQGLYETPVALPETKEVPVNQEAVKVLLQSVRATGRALLNEWESKAVLRAYGIPVVETLPATTPEEAGDCANQVGYPVVLKLLSDTITHKTEAGGVRLGLQSEADVLGAFNGIRESAAKYAGADSFQGVTVQPMVPFKGYELILGSTVDQQLGPVVLFGSGGQMTEILSDRALGIPPFTSTLAMRMMERTKAYKALRNPRAGKPVDMSALEQIVVRFSQLVVQQPEIKEIDINPLLASDKGFFALDARVILHEKGALQSGTVPGPAIRPYPQEYSFTGETKDGTPIRIRPVRPEDEHAIVEFHKELSDETVFMRYFSAQKLSQRISHQRLMRTCFLDYNRELALAALVPGSDGKGGWTIVGVGRIIRKRTPGEASFAMVLQDKFQRRGIGSQLLDRLLEVAVKEGIHTLTAVVLTENRPMQEMLRRYGFTMGEDSDGIRRAVKRLG